VINKIILIFLLLFVCLYAQDKTKTVLHDKLENKKIVESVLDDEFGDDDIIEFVQTKQVKQEDFIINGSISYTQSYNYAHSAPLNNISNDFRGWSGSKISTNVNFEKNINKNYKIKSTLKVFKELIYDLKSDEYQTVPKGYDQDIYLNELYMQGGLNDKIDIKVGRQIVVWGKSDNIRITDTLNPIDNTTPGMVDIKDLRLGTTMTKFDYFINSLTLSGIILHENRFSKLPKYGSDFANNNKIKAQSNSVSKPSNTLENSGIAFSLSGNFQGQDLAIYYSNKYVDNTMYRSNMLGMAYNKVMNSFLLKSEIAYFDNYDDDTIGSRVDMLIGAEYNGISDGSISLEVANKNNDAQYAIRFTQSYINQILDFTVLYLGFGNKQDGLIRTWIDYDYSDNISFNFGVIDYLYENINVFKMVENNDRLFGNMTYSF